MRATLKDKTIRMELVGAAVKTCDPVEGIASAPKKCYACDGPNHMTHDCLAQYKKSKDNCLKPKKNSVLLVQGVGSFVAELFKKRTRMRVYSASLALTKCEFSAATIEVYVCRNRGVALVDSGCSENIVSRRCARHGKRTDQW